MPGTRFRVWGVVWKRKLQGVPRNLAAHVSIFAGPDPGLATRSRRATRRSSAQPVDRFRGRYLTIISEPLDDIEAQIGLLEYTDWVMRDRLRKQDLTKGDRTVPPHFAAHQSMQYEYSARLHGMRITYLATIVQGARAFHQVGLLVAIVGV